MCFPFSVRALRAGNGSTLTITLPYNVSRADSDRFQAMRAGANEFFPWTVGEQTQASRAMEESFHGAVRRTSTRREAGECSTRDQLGRSRAACRPRQRA